MRYAFIDSQNLYLGVKSRGWTIDVQRFRIYLRDKYHVDKAFLFIGYLPGNELLYTRLQQYGYIVIFKPTLEIKRGTKTIIKGNVDADLVLHAMIEFRNYEKAMIVSGDGDVHCLIEYLEGKGKLLKLLVPSHQYSRLLRVFHEHQHIVCVESFKDSVCVKKKTGIRVRSKP